jgi:hypothetical protein
MGDTHQAVTGCGPGPCCDQVTRGGEAGRVVNTVMIPAGKVCEVEWPDGSTDLLWNPHSG